MGSKQSSSSNFKNQKRMRKLSQDFSSSGFFIVPETMEENLSSGNYKRPVSQFDIKNIYVASNCHQEDRVQAHLSYSNLSTLSVDSSELSKKNSTSVSSSPINLSNSPLSELCELKESSSDQDLQFENNKFKGESANFKWEFGGEKVYLVLIQNSEIIGKEKLNREETLWGQAFFETSIDLYPGQYQYYYVVDGENRYCPDNDTMTINENQIVNYIIIPDLTGESKNQNNLNNNNTNINTGSSFSFSSMSSSTTTTWQQEQATTTTQIKPIPRGMPRIPRATCMKQSARAACCLDKQQIKPKQAKRVHFQDDVDFDHSSRDVVVDDHRVSRVVFVSQ